MCVATAALGHNRLPVGSPGFCSQQLQSCGVRPCSLLEVGAPSPAQASPAHFPSDGQPGPLVVLYLARDATAQEGSVSRARSLETR